MDVSSNSCYAVTSNSNSTIKIWYIKRCDYEINKYA